MVRMCLTASTTLPVPASPFGPDHGGPLADPPQGLAEIDGAANKRHLEVPLIYVVFVVRRCEDLAFVDVVDPDGLEDLGLYEMAYPDLGHHRDTHRVHDLFYYRRVGHPGNAALGPYIGGDSFQRHDRDSAPIFGYLGLLGCRDVHYHAALEHLGQARPDGKCPE